VGALSGLGLGIALGIADLGSTPPSTGWLVMRDMGYGTGLGTIVGAAVGALFLIDDGSARDLLRGASIGAIAGAGAGLAFGLLQGATIDREPERKSKSAASGVRVRFTITAVEDEATPLPAVVGEF